MLMNFYHHIINDWLTSLTEEHVYMAAIHGEANGAGG